MHRPSSSLLRLIPIALAVAFALLVPSEAAAQPTRLLEDVLGFGEVDPFARVLFHQEGEELCATLAISRGPRAKNKNAFLFRRLVEPKVDKLKSRLVFDFPKEPDRVEGSLRAWVACTESPPRFEQAERDVVELTVRDANAANEDLRLYVKYPAAGEASAMDVLLDGTGGLMGKGFVRPL